MSPKFWLVIQTGNLHLTQRNFVRHSHLTNCSFYIVTVDREPTTSGTAPAAKRRATSPHCDAKRMKRDAGNYPILLLHIVFFWNTARRKQAIDIQYNGVLCIYFQPRLTIATLATIVARSWPQTVERAGGVSICRTVKSANATWEITVSTNPTSVRWQTNLFVYTITSFRLRLQLSLVWHLLSSFFRHVHANVIVVPASTMP